jgi:phosphoglycolate phosphatase
MQTSKKVLISFDLDFTLVNNKQGIIDSFKYALDKFNVPHIQDSEILRMIGLPLADMFQKVSNLDTNKLMDAFREYYKVKGIYQIELLSGVREKLIELKDNPFFLGIITSKKEEMARKVVKYLGISHFFEYIIGEGKIMKTKMDPCLVKHLYIDYPNYQFIIVGDHPKDRILAENLGAPFIGVLTGNHSAEELQRNCNTEIFILNSVRELSPKIIYSLV